MKTKSNKLASAGLISALSASLCCITPVLALFSGASGLAATFSWLVPLRPYFIVITALIIGCAWYLKLKSNKVTESECCKIDEKISFWQTKKFLALITFFATSMLLFPYYGHHFYHQQSKQTEVLSQNDLKVISFSIKGMTCKSCENHVINVVNHLPGINSVLVDHKLGTAIINYDASKTNIFSISSAINSTGYEVLKASIKDKALITVDESSGCCK